MSIVFRAALAATVLAGCAAFVRADAKDDIKQSGVAFAKALHEGDIKQAKNYAVADSKTSRFIDALAPVTAAREKMIDASVAKFGDSGKTIIGEGRGAAATPQYSPKDFDDAQIDVQGDTATLRPKNDTTAGANKSLKFRKEGGTWKVDLGGTLTDEQLDRIVQFMPKVTTAMDETTGEIKDGKYQNVTQARQALGRHMAAAMGYNGAPGGRPGTR